MGFAFRPKCGILTVMSHRLICVWLGLPPESWPPDHYALLGLTVGESDVVLIEERVHERLARLRPYQLQHPDQVTVAMNRLAQAFACLTDPESKRAYDVSLASPTASPGTALENFRRVENLPPPFIPAPSGTTPPLAAGTVPASSGAAGDSLAWLLGAMNPLAVTGAPAPAAGPSPAQTSAAPAPVPISQADWAQTPPPSRLAPEPISVSEASPAATGTTDPPVTSELPGTSAAGPPQDAPFDPVLEIARSSTSARRGLGTKRALYFRLARTRQLLRAWERAGKYLSAPEQRLKRRSEAKDLVRQLREVHELLDGFPPLLGEAGLPGYLVVALARQQMIVPTFRDLLSSQREALARDWRAGRSLLVLHREFLREEIRKLRAKSIWGRTARAVWAGLTDQPRVLVLFLVLLALNLALWFYFTR